MSPLSTLAILFCLCAFATAIPVAPGVPSLLPGETWNTNSFTCTGNSYSRSVDPTYAGVPPPSPSPFTVATNPTLQEWSIVFGAPGAQSIQYANATGAWTLIPPLGWFAINGVDFTVEADFQGYTVDVSTEECLIQNVGLIQDITSCQCALTSAITLWSNRTPLCRDLSILEGQPSGENEVYFRSWPFAQKFSVENVAGIFIADYCVSTAPSTIVVPAGDYPDFCSVFAPPSCLPTPPQ